MKKIFLVSVVLLCMTTISAKKMTAFYYLKGVPSINVETDFTDFVVSGYTEEDIQQLVPTEQKGWTLQLIMGLNNSDFEDIDNLKLGVLPHAPYTIKVFFKYLLLDENCIATFTVEDVNHQVLYESQMECNAADVDKNTPDKISIPIGKSCKEMGETIGDFIVDNM